MTNLASIAVAILLAQAAPTPASPEAKARAQALLREGAAFYEKGNAAEALDKFNEAYAVYPSPKLWFNIGQADRDIGRPAEAMNAFERFLAEARDASAISINEADRSVAELRTKLGRLAIDCSTEGAEVEVDGKPVGNAPIPGSFWVVPGRHQVAARQTNAAPTMEYVEVAAGTIRTVVLRPAPPPEAPRVSLAQSSTAELQGTSLPAPAGEDQGWWLGRKWTWVAAGSTVVFVGMAAIFGASMESKFNSLNGSCGSAGKSTVACSESQIGEVTTLKNSANAFWGLAAAAAVTTGILFFIEGRPVTVTPMAGDTTGFLASVRY
jgi:hypothetical protein